MDTSDSECYPPARFMFSEKSMSFTRFAGGFAAITLCWFLSASPVVAAGQSNQKAQAQELRAMEAFSTGKPLTAEDRRVLARSWLASIRKLNNAVPTLSPSESAWLKREIGDEIARNGGRFTERSLAALDSAENQTALAGRFVADATAHLDRLSVGGLPEREEALLWAALASTFLDRAAQEAVEGLVKRGRVPASARPMPAPYVENVAMWGKGILDQMVIPHLQGR